MFSSWVGIRRFELQKQAFELLEFRQVPRPAHAQMFPKIKGRPVQEGMGALGILEPLYQSPQDEVPKYEGRIHSALVFDAAAGDGTEVRDDGHRLQAGGGEILGKFAAYERFQQFVEGRLGHELQFLGIPEQGKPAVGGLQVPGQFGSERGKLPFGNAEHPSGLGKRKRLSMDEEQGFKLRQFMRVRVLRHISRSFSRLYQKKRPFAPIKS